MNNYNSTESILARVPNYIKKNISKANLPDLLALEIISKVGNTKENKRKDKEKPEDKNFIEKVAWFNLIEEKSFFLCKKEV